MAYSLAREAWIPVLGPGGLEDVSTRDALCRAHELHTVAGSPTERVVILRHLIAVLMRSHRLPDDDAVEALRERGRLDAEAIDAYLDEVVLDLEHPTRPFAQCRGLAAQLVAESRRGGDALVPVVRMTVTGSSWGAGRALMGPQSEPAMDSAQAARAMLVHHAYAPGGLIKAPGEPAAATASPLLTRIVAIVAGRTLLDTLLSTLTPCPEPGLPSWELPPPPLRLSVGAGEREPAEPPSSYLESLTWLSRRLELASDPDDGQWTHYARGVYKGLEDHIDPMAVTTRYGIKRGATDLPPGTPLTARPRDGGAWMRALAHLPAHARRIRSRSRVDLVCLSAHQSKLHGEVVRSFWVEPGHVTDEGGRAIEAAVAALSEGAWSIEQAALAATSAASGVDENSARQAKREARERARGLRGADRYWHEAPQLFERFLSAGPEADLQQLRGEVAALVERVGRAAVRHTGRRGEVEGLKALQGTLKWLVRADDRPSHVR